MPAPNLDRTLAFDRVLGFTLARRATGDDMAIVRNPQGVEINLISMPTPASRPKTS